MHALHAQLSSTVLRMFFLCSDLNTAGLSIPCFWSLMLPFSCSPSLSCVRVYCTLWMRGNNWQLEQILIYVTRVHCLPPWQQSFVSHMEQPCTICRAEHPWNRGTCTGLSVQRCLRWAESWGEDRYHILQGKTVQSSLSYLFAFW